MWVPDLIKSFPRLAGQSLHFYFRPTMFLRDRNWGTPPTLWHTFGSIGALVFLASAVVSFLPPRDSVHSYYVPQAVVINDAIEYTHPPHVEAIDILGSQISPGLAAGFSFESGASVPLYSNRRPQCEFFSDWGSEGDWSHAQRVRFDPNNASPAYFESIVGKPIDTRDAVLLEEWMRKSFDRMCPKGYVFYSYQPDFAMYGASKAYADRLDRSFVRAPWSARDKVIFEPPLFKLGFGLLSVGITGISPADVTPDVWAVYLASFLLPVGVAAALAFRRKDLVFKAAVRDGFNVAAAIVLIPIVLFVVSAVIQSLVGETKCGTDIVAVADRYFIHGRPVAQRVNVCSVAPIATYSGQAMGLLFLFATGRLMFESLKRQAKHEDWRRDVVGLFARGGLFVLVTLSAWTLILPVVDTPLLVFHAWLGRFL